MSSSSSSSSVDLITKCQRRKRKRREWKRQQQQRNTKTKRENEYASNSTENVVNKNEECNDSQRRTIHRGQDEEDGSRCRRRRSLQRMMRCGILFTVSTPTRMKRATCELINLLENNYCRSSSHDDDPEVEKGKNNLLPGEGGGGIAMVASSTPPTLSISEQLSRELCQLKSGRGNREDVDEDNRTRGGRRRRLFKWEFDINRGVGFVRFLDEEDGDEKEESTFLSISSS